MSKLFIRPGKFEDSFTVFNIFERSLADLGRRFGSTSSFSTDDLRSLENMWAERRSLYEHLALTADQFWLAEREGIAIGYARSIVRDGVRQLTELFVLPGEQAGGIGRKLMAHAFPPIQYAKHNSIIASPDSPAQVLYLKSGVYPRFPVYYFGRSPEKLSFSSDLTIEPFQDSPSNLATLAEIDNTVLGFTRQVDHNWLLSERQGYLYFRRDQPVGYGYLGVRNGPLALLDEADFPAVLAHAESQAAAQCRTEFGLEVPMINQVAVDYLLGRGFRMDAFMAVMMTDKPFARFENYILTSPPFFM
ncbi:MAG: GNAT family N-acetyltransferase [Anaerolineales bacterium]